MANPETALLGRGFAQRISCWVMPREVAMKSTQVYQFTPMCRIDACMNHTG